jgi:tetratricopeptide (TPR) repeat protein
MPCIPCSQCGYLVCYLDDYRGTLSCPACGEPLADTAGATLALSPPAAPPSQHLPVAPSRQAAAGFAALLWGLLFVCVSAGFHLTVGKEQIYVDLFPDFVGYILLVAGASRVALVHPHARSVRNFALFLNFFSVLMIFQVRTSAPLERGLNVWISALWAVPLAANLLNAVLVWMLCGVVADLAGQAGELRIEGRALLRRKAYVLVTLLGWAVLLAGLGGPAAMLIGFLVILPLGILVTCLLMGLMNDARRMCLSHDMAASTEVEAAARQGWGLLLLRAAGVVVPLLAIAAGIWYYEAWQATRQEVLRSDQALSEVAARFQAAVEAGRLEEAYALTGPGLRARMSELAFQEMVRRCPVLAGARAEGGGGGMGTSGGAVRVEEYREAEDTDGRRWRYTWAVARPEQSIFQPSPPPPGVEEFKIEEVFRPDSQARRLVARTRKCTEQVPRLLLAGKAAEAEALCHQAVAASKELTAGHQPALLPQAPALYSLYLAFALTAREHYPEAEQVLAGALKDRDNLRTLDDLLRTWGWRPTQQQVPAELIGQGQQLALRLMHKATELAPGKADYWHGLALVHYRLKDARAAIVSLGKARALRPADDGHDWLLLALAYQKVGESKQARQAYARAVACLKGRPPDAYAEALRMEVRAALGKAAAEVEKMQGAAGLK